MLAALLFGLALAPGFDFYAYGPYANVPTPDQILGHQAGERHTTYMEQERVIRLMAQASPSNCKLTTFGSSWEGRALRLLAISSPENIARLDEIQKDNQMLAAGQAPNHPVPAIVWINETIHGNEPASFESAMWLAYTLIASQSPEIQNRLKNTVVLLNPCYNPDGHERFVVWYNSIATGNPDPNAFEQAEPSVIQGRFNHYRFDMNRDRVAMSQHETRLEVQEYLKWFPHVYIDQHGQVETYFFPPNAMSVNANVDRERMEKWTVIFGKATAAAFDKNGFQYYIRDVFDLYYPGYLDSWTSLSGSIGMTHETDGPKSLAVRRKDGSISTFRGGIEKHFTSALAVIKAASDNHDALVGSFADYKKQAVTGAHAGKYKFFVARGSQESLMQLQEHLARSGIRSYESAGFSAKKAHSIWTDADEDVTFTQGQVLVVPMAQPQGHLAKALLETQSDFEKEFVEEQMRRRKQATSGESYPGPDPYEFYDLTAWNVALGHELEGWWIDTAPTGETPTQLASATIEDGNDVVGWAIPPSQDATLLALNLMSRDWRILTSGRDMKVGGESLPAGSLFLLKSRNAPNPDEAATVWDNRMTALHQLSAEFHGKVIALKTSYPDSGRYGPGSEMLASLRKPKIGVVFGGANRTDFGSTWYTLDNFNVPFTPLHSNALNGDLSAYSCILFPQGQYGAPSDSLKKWIEGGGCAVILGGGNWLMGDKGMLPLKAVKGEIGELPGSLFVAELDPRSFLSYGYERRGEGKIPLAVPVAGNSFMKAKESGGGAVVFSSDEKKKKLLSGWEWPDDTEKNLRGAAWLHDEPVGQGHIIWFAEDPTERAMWPGLNRLLLNAMLYGPS